MMPSAVSFVSRIAAKIRIAAKFRKGSPRPLAPPIPEGHQVVEEPVPDNLEGPPAPPDQVIITD